MRINSLNLKDLSIAGLFLFIPFSGIGVYINNFLLNALLIPFLLLSLFLFFEKINLKSFIAILSMLVCFFLSSISRHSISSFLLPLIITAILVIPFCISIKKNQTFFEKLFRLSLILVLVIVSIEFLITRTYPLIWLEIEKLILLQGASVDYFGSRRLRGAFIEPSILGLVLNYYYLCSIHFFTKGYQYYRFFIPLIILMLILTFSSSAYITFAGNYRLKRSFIFKNSYILWRK